MLQKNLYRLCCLIFGEQILKSAFEHQSSACLRLLRVKSILVPEDAHLWDKISIPQQTLNRQFILYAYLQNRTFESIYPTNIEQCTKIEELQKLGLFISLYDLAQNKPFEDCSFCFFSFRLKGVRELIHPRSSEINPFSLSALYSHVYWSLQNLNSSFLYLTEHSPFSLLATTLSRSTMLLDRNRLNNLGEIIQVLEKRLKCENPTLSIETKMEEIQLTDIDNIDFDEKIVACNQSEQSKKIEKTNFYLQENALHITEGFECQNKLKSFLQSENVLLKKYDKFTSLPISYEPHERGDIVNGCQFYVDLKKTSLFHNQVDLGEKHFGHFSLKILGPSTFKKTTAFLRIDVSAFLKNMKEFSKGVLHRQQVFRCFHQLFFFQEIPKLIEEYNLKLLPEERILIMHSVLDDCTLFGCKEDLEVIAVQLRERYRQNWNGSLKLGFGIIGDDSNAASISYEALTNLI